MTNLQTAIEALEHIRKVCMTKNPATVYEVAVEALTALRAMEGQTVSREAIATALCGAAGSVGGDWRDKKMVRIEGSKDRIVDAIYALQLPAPQPASPPIPTVERDFEAGWNAACDNIEESGPIYSVALRRYKEELTARLKGADHESRRS